MVTSVNSRPSLPTFHSFIVEEMEFWIAQSLLGSSKNLLIHLPLCGVALHITDVSTHSTEAHTQSVWVGKWNDPRTVSQRFMSRCCWATCWSRLAAPLKLSSVRETRYYVVAVAVSQVWMRVGDPMNVKQAVAEKRRAWSANPSWGKDTLTDEGYCRTRCLTQSSLTSLLSMPGFWTVLIFILWQPAKTLDHLFWKLASCLILGLRDKSNICYYLFVVSTCVRLCSAFEQWLVSWQQCASSVCRDDNESSMWLTNVT